jgi:hypothetical protein
VSPNFPAPPPRVPAAAIDPSPPVKDWFPLPVLFDFWDRQELNEHVLSQVLVPDACGSRAPSSPERRPSRRRRRDPSLLPLHAVSKNPRPIPLYFAHSIVSPLRCRPPVRPDRPLTLWSRAQAPALHVAPTRGQKDGRERRPGLASASPCRASPHFGVLAVAPARARPGPSDLARTAQITYPFV